MLIIYYIIGKSILLPPPTLGLIIFFSVHGFLNFPNKHNVNWINLSNTFERRANAASLSRSKVYINMAISSKVHNSKQTHYIRYILFKAILIIRVHGI